MDTNGTRSFRLPLALALTTAVTLSGSPGASAHLPPASGTKSVVQQLAEALEPLDVRVVTEALTPAGTGTREVRLRWAAKVLSATPSVPKAARVSGAFSIAGERKYPDDPPRLRSMELSPGSLLIVGLDATRQVKSWTVVPDPRIVRSEGPGPDGVLTGRILYLEEAELLVSLPDDPEILEIRLYEPKASSTPSRLEAAGSVRLR